MYSKYLIQQKNINLSTQIQTKLTEKQKILLYLKFYSKSKVINFVDFSKVFNTKYRSYQYNIDSLLNEKIIKEYKNKKPRSFKLIVKSNEIKIFENATNEEEYLFYQYLRTNDKELENIVNIIINLEAIKLLHEFQNSEQTRFHFSRKTKALNHLIRYNAVKKLKLPAKTYTLTENYNELKYKLEQAKLKKKPKILSEDLNLNDIILYTSYRQNFNFHNLEITTQINNSYDDIGQNPSYQPLTTNNKPIRILKQFEYEPKTFITAHIYKSNTLVITVGCSKNPILINDTKRLNFILLEVFEKLNEISPIAKYSDNSNYYQWHDYSYTITKHDFATDIILPYKLPERYEKEYTNQNNEIINFYVKESYKDYSKVRFEQRAIDKPYKLPDFRAMAQTRILNIIPK